MKNLIQNLLAHSILVCTCMAASSSVVSAPIAEVNHIAMEALSKNNFTDQLEAEWFFSDPIDKTVYAFRSGTVDYKFLAKLYIFPGDHNVEALVQQPERPLTEEQESILVEATLTGEILSNHYGFDLGADACLDVYISKGVLPAFVKGKNPLVEPDALYVDDRAELMNKIPVTAFALDNHGRVLESLVNRENNPDVFNAICESLSESHPTLPLTGVKRADEVVAGEYAVFTFDKDSDQSETLLNELMADLILKTENPDQKWHLKNNIIEPIGNWLHQQEEECIVVTRKAQAILLKLKRNWDIESD